MSKGSKIVQFRLPPALEAEVGITIARRNLYRRGRPWDRTGFLLTAIREKIAKMERSRRKNTGASKRKTADSGQQ